MFRNTAIAAIVFALVLMMTGCGSRGSDSPRIETLDVSTNAQSISKGVDLLVTVQARYDDNTTRNVTDKCTFTVSDPSVLEYNGTTSAPSARFRTMQVGAGTVQADFSGLDANITIEVTEATLTAMRITPTSLTLAKGETSSLNAVGTYTDDSTADLSTQVDWNSTAPNVAAVDSNGHVQALAEGAADIYAAFGSVRSDALALTVTPAELTGLEIAPDSAQIMEGDALQYTVRGLMSDGTESDIGQSAQWSSDDPGIVSIDGSGMASAIAAGSTIIHVTDGTFSAQTTVSVNAAELLSIALNTSSSIEEGTSAAIEAVGTYSNGTEKPITDSVSWSSDNTSVIMMAGNEMQALQVGNANITASLQGVTETVTVSVTPQDWREHVSLRLAAQSYSMLNGYYAAGSQFTYSVTNSSKSSLNITAMKATDGNGGVIYSDNTTVSLPSGTSKSLTLTLNRSVRAPITFSVTLVKPSTSESKTLSTP